MSIRGLCRRPIRESSPGDEGPLFLKPPSGRTISHRTCHTGPKSDQPGHENIQGKSTHQPRNNPGCDTDGRCVLPQPAPVTSTGNRSVDVNAALNVLPSTANSVPRHERKPCVSGQSCGLHRKARWRPMSGADRWTPSSSVTATSSTRCSVSCSEPPIPRMTAVSESAARPEAP